MLLEFAGCVLISDELLALGREAGDGEGADAEEVLSELHLGNRFGLGEGAEAVGGLRAGVVEIGI